MPPKIKPKSQPPRKQVDNGNEGPNPESTTSVVAALSEATASTTVQASSQSPSLRPPVARLESIAGGPPIPGAAKAPLKYKPKGISRRSKEEREKTEREEQERLAARAVAGTPTTGTGREGRGSGRGGARGDLRGGMRGRGRGGAFRGDRVQGIASGPFASMSAVTGQGPRRDLTRSSAAPASISHADAKVKLEEQATSKQDGDKVIAGGPDIKAEIDELYKSSSDGEDANEGERVNVELIGHFNDRGLYGSPNAKSKDRGGGPFYSGVMGMGGLFPIRIDRKEHVDRAVGASIEASLGPPARVRTTGRTSGDNSLFFPEGEKPEEESSQDGGKGKDVEFIMDQRRWRGVYGDDDDVEVKSEPGDTADPMALDAPRFVEDTEMADAPEPSVPPPSKPSEKETKLPQQRRDSKKRKIPHSRDFKPPIQADRERAEWERHEEDMHALVEELGAVGVAERSVGPAPAGTDGEPASAIATDPHPPTNPRDGRIYLFQLPPVIPPLAPAVKPDPLSPPSPSMATPNPPTITNPPPITTAQPQSLAVAEGLVGRMRVHRSGRVTMEWGGPRLEVQRGVEWGFLTDVVVTEEEGEERRGCGMGSVRAKFVAVPEWKSLLG